MEVMVDIETLNTNSKAVVLSIGAVAFALKGDALGEEFQAVLEIQPQLDAGRTIGGNTIKWWMQQSAAARDAAFLNIAPFQPAQALMDFNRYLSRQQGTGNEMIKDEPRLWGNGSDFDNVILASLYADLGITPGWKFYNNRCFRTMKSLFHVEEPARLGTHHNALDDAKHQARWLQKIVKDHGVNGWLKQG